MKKPISFVGKSREKTEVRQQRAAIITELVDFSKILLGDSQGAKGDAPV